jgi:nucleoid-associated protein YgaU
MTRTSIIRIVVPSLALIAAGGAALVLGTAHLWREPPVEASAVTSAAAVAPPFSGGQEQRSTALAAAQAETKNVTAALAGPSGSPGVGYEIRPAFDVTRIEPSGDAVIAGRAAPGASVELLRNGEPHDRVVADQSGQFVMVPSRLPPGDYELTLRSRLPDGRQATSKQSVVVALQPNLKDRPVVALMTPGKPSVVLSKPAAPNATGAPVAVETVEAEPSGKLYVSGRSPPGAAVRLYLNDSYLASTTAAADGRFAFTINEGVGPGGYRVRLDEVESGSGAIRSRAEVPFSMPETVAANGSGLNHTVGSSQGRQASQRPLQGEKPQDMAGAAESQAAAATSAADAGSSAAVVVPKVTTVVVSRGDSLWRISRATYGAGERYSVIYGANHNQIRNPNRIYPGQVFVLPEKAR